MRELLEKLDNELAFHTSGRFDLLAGEHIPYVDLGASDVDAALRRSIERGEGVTSVVGRIGAGKSSLIAAVTDSLHEGFLPVRVSVIGVEAGEPAAFARHSIAEISDLPEVVLTRHEAKALSRAQAEQQTVTTSRELRAGFKIAAGHVLTGAVVADLKRAASEQLARATDPAETLRGIQRLFDVVWGIERCPLLVVEDTDHWGAAPETAEAFFDQTARAFANMDGVMIVAAQSDYTQLDGYKRVRNRLTAEVVLPELPDPQRGLTTVLERRIALAGVKAPLEDVLASDGLDLLCDSYAESVSNGEAGDLRRTLAVMRTALDIAIGDPSVQILSAGQIQEAVARTPLPPSSALGSPS